MVYGRYSNKKISITEGVMGFYDGEDRKCSTYSVTKLLNIPTLLILNGAGSYITLSAILKGVLEYRRDNTIKAIILNRLSSKMHYKLIKKQIEKDHKDIVVGLDKKGFKISKKHTPRVDLEDLEK